MFRGAVVLLVMWDHLVGGWLDTNHRSWVPLQDVRNYVNTPTGIIQDFGWLGVVLFFLVSGFIITHVGRRESRLEFSVKRLLRIYPPFIFSILLIIGVAALRPSLGLARGLPSFFVRRGRAVDDARELHPDPAATGERRRVDTLHRAGLLQPLLAAATAAAALPAGGGDVGTGDHAVGHPDAR